MTRIFFHLLLMSAAAFTYAAPGAHGPNGEHLDAPAGTQVSSVNAVPRFETSTETFELVGHLYGDELSVLVDRFETNEPVHNGKVEVELNGIKAGSKFHPDHGDYSFTDERLLKALAKPGKHALVFTVFAGKESDLMEGTLEINIADAAHDHAPTRSWQWAIGTALLLTSLAAIVWMRRRSPQMGKR